LPQYKKQKQLVMFLSSETCTSTIQSWKDRNTNDPYLYEKLLVLDSAVNPFSSKWQKVVLPNVGLGQTMSPVEFRAICSMQLLIPIMKEGICGECGKKADPMGYHVVTCGGTVI
jgi:hypothetical protein